MSARLQDFALMIGHVWRCLECRTALLDNPESMWMGFKLSDGQRACILELSDESFQSMTRLTDLTGLSARELEAAIEHPRARLRHLGSARGDYFFRPNGNR